MPHFQSGLRHQLGTSLVEALVTAVVMAIGLLGMAGLQTKSIQFNHAAYLRTQVNALASDITERMRANAGKVSDYNTSGTAGDDLAKRDVENWKNQVTALLPQGEGEIICDGDKNCTITLKWGESSDPASTGSPGQSRQSSPPNSFTYSTTI